MLQVQGDLGEAVFKEWTEEEKRDEIGKLVVGFRAGLPIGIVCNMAAKIAGSEASARRYLLTFMTFDERKAAVANESDSMKGLISRFLGI